ncbi:MAG: peptidoglycan DD-metalloendopeptidase family protein, partial [Firmicutes bacterium]|nr:peptidoglycan DD-metalloendopeptidase family protein [Bacillota bacterium]
LATVTVMALVAPYAVSAAKSVAQLRQEQQALQQKKKDLQAALENVKALQQEIAAEIIELDIKVTEAEYELNLVLDELADAEERLAQSEQDLANARDAKVRHTELFKTRIKYIHENGNIGYLDIIMDSRNITDLLSRMQYVNDIMEYDRDTLNELVRIEELIDKKTQEIAEEKANIEVVAAEKQQRADELEALMKEKQATAAKYEADEASYERSLEQWEADSANVEKLIQQALAAEAAAAEAARNAGNSSPAPTYSGGAFVWPVPSSSRVSSGYGYRDRVFGSGTEFHTGIDIPAGYGNDVIAAEGGKVITSKYVSGYGYTVIINHGSGVTSLYGHNSKLLVSVGDTVSKGQTIALIGSTGNSTGNHLHFEVRLNGSHQNPYNYLG